jgi:O-antigen/teichoic acid export membrane protein
MHRRAKSAELHLHRLALTLLYASAMAVVSFPLSQPLSRMPRLSVMSRGALLTLGGHVTSLARPIAVAWFARMHGAASLGGFLLIWALVELGARLATMGLDRGLQRWADDRRAAATVAGMVMAGITGLAMAAVLVIAVPRFGALDRDGVVPAQLLLLVALPLTAIGNVALRASRGGTQITTYVLARSVTEPVLLLIAGLVSSPYSTGSVALPASLMISVVGGAAVAAIGLVRAFGVRKLAVAAVHVRAWPVRELVRTSLPLGFADLLQSAQSKLDLLAVALLTLSARAIASYAIAAEVAGVYVAIRGGFDQVVAPLAVEARRNRSELRRILTTATRWSWMIAVPVGFVILASPEGLLRWFGGSDGAVAVLVALSVGRAVEMILAPSASMLAMIGDPRLSLLDAGAGVAVATLGSIAAGFLGLGPSAIAVASAAGVVVSSVLARHWMTRLPGYRA